METPEREERTDATSESRVTETSPTSHQMPNYWKLREHEAESVVLSTIMQ